MDGDGSTVVDSSPTLATCSAVPNRMCLGGMALQTQSPPCDIAATVLSDTPRSTAPAMAVGNKPAVAKTKSVRFSVSEDSARAKGGAPSPRNAKTSNGPSTSLRGIANKSLASAAGAKSAYHVTNCKPASPGSNSRSAAAGESSPSVKTTISSKSKIPSRSHVSHRNAVLTAGTSQSSSSRSSIATSKRPALGQVNGDPSPASQSSSSSSSRSSSATSKRPALGEVNGAPSLASQSSRSSTATYKRPALGKGNDALSLVNQSCSSSSATSKRPALSKVSGAPSLASQSSSSRSSTATSKRPALGNVNGAPSLRTKASSASSHPSEGKGSLQHKTRLG